MHYLQLIFLFVLPNLLELGELMMPSIISRINELTSTKSKAVNQSKDRLETEAKDKAIANHRNNAGTKT